MERRRLGQLEVSAVGLGCGTMTPFYGEPDRAAGIATIRRAREIGVDLLDTADGYGRGRNEELVAEAVRGHRGDYVSDLAPFSCLTAPRTSLYTLSLLDALPI